MGPIAEQQTSRRAEGWHAFLSYRRGAATELVRQVRGALETAGLKVFTDERDIPWDAAFPSEIADALLGSRIVIAFLDAEYFKSQWCLYELQVALAPLRRDPEDIAHVLPVLVAQDAGEILAHLPPALARSSCSGADVPSIVQRVRDRIRTVHAPIADRLSADDDAVRALRLGGAVPPAESLSDVPGFRPGMPLSLKNRFQGRAIDLWSIFHELATITPHAAPRSCCISGPPGMGKTQLVAEFAWRYGRRHFGGGVVWVDASTDPDRVEKQIASALAGLHGAPVGERTPPAVLQRASAKGRVLWIVDGISPSAASGAGSLDALCPVRTDVTLLCTSRSARLIDAEVSIDLAPLSEAAAVDLLTGKSVRRAMLADEEWARIARWVGCVPQALEIQHAVLSSSFREPRALLAAAQRKANPVEEIDTQFAELRRELPTGSILGISETFGIWYGNLKADPKLLRAAHILARSIGNPLMVQAVPRAALATLALRSWIRRVDDPDGKASNETWRMNDLVRSYLLGVSADPALEVVQLARAFLGIESSARTVMVGMPRGGLEILSNVRSVGAASLDDVALDVLERAVATPDDADLAGAADLLGALRNESARARLSRRLQAVPDDACWPLILYLRYVQGFERAPADPKILTNESGTMLLAAESLLSPPITPQERQSLMAPLLALLREWPLRFAALAAAYMAKVAPTREVVESEVLELTKRTPDRAAALAASILAADVESAKAHAAFGMTSTESSTEVRIECLKEAVRREPLLYEAHVALARLLAPPHHAGESSSTMLGGGHEAQTLIDTEAVESRLDLGALSVSIPSDWTQEVRHFARCSELIAHPRTAAGPPPINLVVKWCVPSGTDVDQIVVDYLRLMGLVGSLEDLSVRCVTDRPEEAFRVSFLLRIAGQSVRQHSLILRAEQHDVSATITHKMEGAFRPYMIERCLSSITIAAP